ncbi:MAG TPA: hypothetical protein VII09_09655 [Opitutaceae bacterium]
MHSSQYMRISCALAGMFLFGGNVAHAQPAAARIHLKISADTQIVDSFTRWNAATPWEQVTQYSGSYVNRPTVDLVLELQALKAGGLDFDFELVATPNYERAKLEAVEGLVDLSAETIWDDEIAQNADSLSKSDVVLANGEFEKGVYTLPTNSKLLSITSLDELRQYVGVTVGTWALDVKTMESMKLKGVERAIKIENVFLMIQKQRADFTLTEFSGTSDLSVENSGVTLVPVPNCKVAIAGSRSWVVSRKSPNSDAILTALQKGIKILRAEGRIDRALKESGFLNPKVSDWKRLF